MKKYLLSFAVLMAGITTLTSCDDDEEDNSLPTIDPVLVDINRGIYVINSGNEGYQIDGSLTYINAETWATSNKAFLAANGRSLGLTANDGVVYGSKLYVVVTQENTVEVIDNNNMKSLKQIKTADAMGADKGAQPRHIAAYNGKVYVTTFSGYVAEIDTATYDVTNTFPVTNVADEVAQSYPEGITAAEGRLYVANSSYGNGICPSVAIIDIASGNISVLKDDNINNPNDVAIINGKLYVLDYGTYDANWNQSGAGVREISGRNVKKVVDGTAMAFAGNKIYTINAPYTYPATTPSYYVYDITTSKTSEFITSSGADAPYSACAIKADPVRGYVYIASYNQDPDTKYTGYGIDAYVNVYDADGSVVKKNLTCGVCPTAIVLNNGTVWE